MIKLKWERMLDIEEVFFRDINSGEYRSKDEKSYITQRAKVPGGWLVRCTEKISGEGIGVGLTFYPDPNHEWK